MHTTTLFCMTSSVWTLRSHLLSLPQNLRLLRLCSHHQAIHLSDTPPLHFQIQPFLIPIRTITPLSLLIRHLHPWPTPTYYLILSNLPSTFAKIFKIIFHSFTTLFNSSVFNIPTPSLALPVPKTKTVPFHHHIQPSFLKHALHTSMLCRVISPLHIHAL